MFRTTKTKLLIPMFVLTAILILLGGMLIYSYYYKILSLNELNEKIIFSSKISDTLHSLQKERGLSCGYVVNKNEKFKKELLLQRKQSDTKIKMMRNFLENISSKQFKYSSQKLLFNVSKLNQIRAKIDKYNLPYNSVIKYYSTINACLLDIIINISKNSHIPLITQNILAYSNFLYLKENMGIERAEGVTIFSQNKITRKTLIELSNTISIEKQNKNRFLKYASDNIKNYYYTSVHSSSFDEVQRMREIMMYKEVSSSNIDSAVWYKTITKSLNILDNVGRFIKNETTKNIKTQLQKVNTTFIFITFLTLLSIVLFIFMLISFLKLADEEQKLRIVLDKYIISSVTDLKGKIIDVSQAFCNISGYTKEELIGSNHNIVRHPDMPKKAFKELWDTISKGKSWSGKVKNLKKDGGFYWVYANVEPLRDTHGNIDSYVSVRLDITQNELLTLKVQEEIEKNISTKEMMQQQSRLAQMGEMLSMIAHQWRQPLSAITAASGSITLKAKLNKLDQKTAIEISNRIKEFSQHLSITIDDFRDFFKSNKSKSETDFHTITTAVLNIVESSINNNGIKLTKNIKTNDRFFTYENELKQVLLNIIKNAEDALIDNNQKNPEILIEAHDNILSVSDNAGGISQDIIDKIFDPYFSTKTKKDGTGLGLYMSKIIIEDHCNGRLSVNNDELGAKFQIILGDIYD